LHGFPAIALLAITFTALIFVAVNEVRKKRTAANMRNRENLNPNNPAGRGPTTGGAAPIDLQPDHRIEPELRDPLCEPAPPAVLAKTET
jgi:hypothetical protein